MIRKLVRKVLGGGYSNLNIELASAFVASRNIEGDYFEFGVYRGDSFAHAYKHLQQNRNSIYDHHVKSKIPIPATLSSRVRYFAFDSFKGLPAISGADLTDKIPSHWEEGQYGASKHEFTSNLKQQKVNLSDVVIVDGWYEATLTGETKRLNNIGKGCIFHIDCDLYESTKLVLEFIQNAYVDGSVIIFDDWFGFKGNPKHGEQKAFREWQEQYNIPASEFSRFGGRSVAFILHAD